MKYEWMLRPEAFKDKSEEEIVKEIESKAIVQMGVQTMKDDVAKNWAEDAVSKGWIVIRRENHTELYEKKR